MILVILGTQDKKFPRLLEAIDKEVKNGTIKDKVVVQAGQTDYSSPNMEIFDLLPAPEFEKLMDQADLIITHGGAGSILSAIKKGKKVIAAARLARYHEHHNDHQKQIIREFADQGYILELKDFHKLGKLIEKSSNFKPKKFESKNKGWVKEAISFFLFRVFSLIMDMGLMYLFIDVFHIHELLSKVIVNVVVIIVNYIFSKLFIFKK